ncbi:MAG: hypothetical protein DMG22_05250 [Acidobacteria bacterium]|nr:MAG: hypothetical protein DMG22_05250 [Acidobacteriota bacterium]
MGTVTPKLEQPSRRRGGRLLLRLIVTISGADAQSNRFEVPAETVDVSKYGAKVRLARELKVGSLLFLLRPDTERSAKFRVVFQSPPDPATGRRDTGIEFVGVDGFWGVQFPPDRTMWA